jgi:hypothetical protein
MVTRKTSGGDSFFWDEAATLKIVVRQPASNAAKTFTLT